MKRRNKQGLFTEILDGLAMGALVTAVFLMAVKINAMGTEADTWLPDAYVQYCESAGEAYNICPELLMAVIEEESGGDPDAVGAAGEVGLMQVYPEYHRERAGRLGVSSLFHPGGNILVAADYLAELFKKYKDVGTVLMVYNGTKDAAARGKSGDYTEYAKTVMKRAEQLERLHKK